LATVTPPVVSPAYVADRWDLKVETIRRQCADGTIPAFKPGRYWRIRLVDIEAIEAGNGHDAA
jgi:excisionase family DNA binding protein